MSDKKDTATPKSTEPLQGIDKTEKQGEIRGSYIPTKSELAPPPPPPPPPKKDE